MKLLIYEWYSYQKEDIYLTLSEMGVSYETFTWDFEKEGHNKNNDPEFVEWFVKNVDTSLFDAVWSTNYWPAISEACEKKGIKYISWSYDSPIDITNPEMTFGNKCNYIFLYDKFEADYYRSQGFDNVYHMPLGVRYQKYEKYDYFRKECDKYRTDVSFVGGLYNNLLGGVLDVVDDSTKSVLERIVEVQTKMPAGNYVLDQLITDGFVELVSRQVLSKIPGFEPITKKQLLYTVAQEVTRKERIILLNLIAARHKMDLYSHQSFDILRNVNQKSTVDYDTQMPLVFAASKINLNPALFAIRTGVSLRAFDITACGGFLLSNYKEEYKDLFDVDKEMVIYDSLEDAVEKVDYYLANEDKRIEIAKAGRKRTKSDHRLENRLARIFELPEL